MQVLMKLCGQNAYMQSIVHVIPMFFYSPFKRMLRIRQIRRTFEQVIPTNQNSLAFPNFQGRVSCCTFVCKVRRCFSINQNVRLHESKHNDIIVCFHCCSPGFAVGLERWVGLAMIQLNDA